MSQSANALAHAALPTPGPIGRSVRLAFGLTLLYLIAPLRHYRLGATLDMSDLLLWVGIGFALWVVPEVVNLGWGRRWGRRPQLAAAGLLVAAALLDLLWSGSLFGPWLGLVLAIFLGYVYLHLGFSFVLAGLIAAPG